MTDMQSTFMRLALGLAGLVFFSLIPAEAGTRPPWLESGWPQLEYRFGWRIPDMPLGNLSGMARCQDRLVGLSDRDDSHLYYLDPYGIYLKAAIQPFTTDALLRPPQPFPLKVATSITRQVRGGQYDFEGLDCDQNGNVYLVSESYVAVLQVTPEGRGSWLHLPDDLFVVAQDQGLLKHANALVEGLAVSADGQQLWLAAERESRGIIHLVRKGDFWVCAAPCVLFSENQSWEPRKGGSVRYHDFSGMSVYREHLFTLERLQRRICRRDLEAGTLQRCWSMHDALTARGYRYRSAGVGGAEGLLIEEGSAWVGFDNTQGSGPVSNSLVVQFKEPAEGWLAP